MTDPLVPLRHADDIAVAGGKAASLATLLGNGLPVPDGLVLPAHVDEGDLPTIADALCVWAREQRLETLVARSSAHVEDGPNTSFAGLFTSVFTPAVPGSVLAALRQVRASAHTASAHEYARTLSQSNDTAIAILVQGALRPYCAGVLAAELSAGERTRFRIEAVRGIAEPIVSGRQTGESHTGHRVDAPVQVDSIEQPTITVPGSEEELRLPPGEWTTLSAAHSAENGTAVKIQTSHCGLLHLYSPAGWEAAPILDARHRCLILELTQKAISCLDLDSIDMEWALTSAGDIVLLQARPLTAPLLGADRAASPPGTWAGIPASPGIGHGPAHHLHDGITNVAGTVLICQELCPESVPTLLQRPAAVVATIGGPLSHTAIVARELQIPCVTAVTSALTAFPPGTDLSVNGTTGDIHQTRSAPPGHSPRENTDPLVGAAVLTHSSPPHIPEDRRSLTLVLHTPASPTPSHLLDSTETPQGLFQPVLQPPFAGAPPGYRDIAVAGLGRMLLPRATPVPALIVAVAPDGAVLHERTVPQ